MTTVCLDIDILTSNCKLLLVFAASSHAEDLYMCIPGHMFGGCIGRITVNKLVSALLLCAKNVHI